MSKICPVCGNLLTDNMQFCDRCGEKLTVTGVSGNTANEQPRQDTISLSEGGELIDSTETIIKTEEFSGILKKTRLYITNQHLYYASERGIVKRKLKFSVPLRNITAAELVYTKNAVFLIISLLCFIKIAADKLKDAFMDEVLYELSGSGYTPESEPSNFVWIVIGLVMIFLFFYIKYVKINIYYPGGWKTIRFHVNSEKRTDVLYRNIREAVDSNTGVSNS